MTPTLIYCADGNKRFANIAIEAGFKYGSQMPRKCYIDDPYFIDVNPKKLPKQPVYIARLRRYRPVMASVHDWFEERLLSTILLRAEEVAQYTERVILIPKVPGIRNLPKFINGKLVVLGYSVPTTHGKTDLPLEDFAGWPIHLLGGSPLQQVNLFKQLSKIADVVSVDGNYAHKMARRNQFFVWDGSATYARNRYWPTIIEADGKPWGDGSKTAGAPYEAFRRSCQSIIEMWSELSHSQLLSTASEQETPLADAVLSQQAGENESS